MTLLQRITNLHYLAAKCEALGLYGMAQSYRNMILKEIENEKPKRAA